MMRVATGDLAPHLGPVGQFTDLFDPEVLSWAVWLNASTGEKALYGLPMGRTTYHVHIWKSLLERAGFTLADIPKEWEAFWSFWCDRVQPAMRRAAGHEDIWGVGLPMAAGSDADGGFLQFVGGDRGGVCDPPMVASSSTTRRSGKS
jgi:multiple sugar transport system substrate-binding protein